MQNYLQNKLLSLLTNKMPVKGRKNRRRKKVKSKAIYVSKRKTVKRQCLVKLAPLRNRQKYICTNHTARDTMNVHSHFSKTMKLSMSKNNYSKNATCKSTIPPLGLSAKDKCYIITNLQNKTSRYSQLKKLADRARRESKIFSIYGACIAIRRALVQRGWVEKIPPYRMNLSKVRNGTISGKPDIHIELERLMLSNLVQKCIPNFVWRDTQQDYNTTIDMKKQCKTIVNKLKTDALWTTKQGLCMSMKTNYWFYIEDVAEVICPRTYNSYDSGEVEEFVTDYKITSCTSLIQWVITMLANDRAVFSEYGTIPIKVLKFALNRCEEYLFCKRNRDVDQPIKTVNTKQWNAFLKIYYRLIAHNEKFEADKANKLPNYLAYAQILLQKIEIYRPQVSCEGYRNIWIIKPAHWSRGRGIRMASKLGVITDLLTKANAEYVVQKYIEKPMLIHDTKFDIRQYYLVTSTYPLVIWMYQDCYLKFSSQKYSLDNYHESIHLTNNAVQRKYTNYVDRHNELPINNMWDLETYKSYLNRIELGGVWENVIYPGMKKSIIGIMLSCQDSLPVCKNRFELYGCDFLLDEEYTPWLIEINSCPDLTSTTDVTAKICPAVLEDVIKVVIDYMADPTASTGKFECIYQQPMTIPKFSSSTELYLRGTSLPNDYFYKGDLGLSQQFSVSKYKTDKLFSKSKLFCTEDIVPLLIDDVTLSFLDNDGLKQSNLHLNEQKENMIVPLMLNADTPRVETRHDEKSSLKKIRGKFECINQQPMTIPKLSSFTELSLRRTSLPNDHYKGASGLSQHITLSVSKDKTDKLFNKPKLFCNEDIVPSIIDDVTLSFLGNDGIKQSNLHLNERKENMIVQSMLNADAPRVETRHDKKLSLKKDDGQFECINQHPMTFLKLTNSKELSLRGTSLPNDHYKVASGLRQHITLSVSKDKTDKLFNKPKLFCNEDIVPSIIDDVTLSFLGNDGIKQSNLHLNERKENMIVPSMMNAVTPRVETRHDKKLPLKKGDGKFECINQQPMTIPKFSNSKELSLRGISLPNDHYKEASGLRQHITHSVSKDKTDKLFNKPKLFCNEDIVSSIIDDRCRSMIIDDVTNDGIKQSNLHLNERKENMIVPSILNAVTPRVETRHYKKSSFKKGHVKNSQNSLNINKLINKLADGSPDRKNNLEAQCGFKKIDTKDDKNFASKKSNVILIKSENKDKFQKKPKDYILQAAPKIIAFINAKEKEYNENSKWPITITEL